MHNGACAEIRDQRLPLWILERCANGCPELTFKFPSGENSRQLLRVYRLGQMQVEPGLRRTAPVLLLPPSGDRDDHHSAVARVLANLARCIVSVKLGQTEI